MKPHTRALSHLFLTAALILFVASLFLPQMKGDTDMAASEVESVVSSRLKKLDKFAAKALAGDPEEWMELGKVPDDMVVYRYVGDRLQSWTNQFPISSDDILPRMSYHRLANPRVMVKSPLSEVGPEYTFFRFGPKSYLIKKVTEGNVKVVVGLSLSGNRRFKIGRGYVMAPLSTMDGTPVKVAGEPRFSVKYDAMPVRSSLPANFVWLAFILFCIGILLALSRKPSAVKALVSSLLMTALAILAFVRHPVLEGDLTQILIILVINLLVFFIAMAIYLARVDIWKRIRKKSLIISLSVLDVLAIALLLVLAYFDIFKVINYTHISLELYKIAQITADTAVVYATFALMFAGLALLLQMLSPAISRLTGRRFDAFSLPGRIIISAAVAAFLVAFTSKIGFQKEELIISQWAENLANERDIVMEDHLRRVERLIAYDEVLAKASESDEFSQMAVDQLSDKYFFRMMQTYDLKVQIGGETEGLGLDSGVQISPGSRFYYSPLQGQRCRYVGAFHYFVPDKGQNTIYVSVEPKDLGERGAFNAMISSPDDGIEIPSIFCYAKYKGMDRQYYKGTYAYPTRLTDEMYGRMMSSETCHFRLNHYVHYVNMVSDDEVIVISRQEMGDARILIAFVLIAILFYFILCCFRAKERKRLAFDKTYFKTSVTLILILSLTITMAVLAFVSVSFVYNRNEANARTMMSDKVNSIRTMLQSGMRNVTSTDELTSRETMDMLRRVSDNTMSDISLFRPDGRVFMSTTPEIFDRMLVGCRINGKAYDEIMYQNRGFSIHKENYGQRRIYTMYAPLLGADGNVVCLFASPYMESSYDFQLDAVMHSVSIIVVFLILLMMSSLLVSFIVDKIFSPLSEMSRKMEKGGIDSLEHITYDHNDEIQSIVNSYNRMVDDLAASSKTLAQAERDKAWSEMARNVAHEIKNPLTPMQLQIQRVQRLKALGDPSWQTKFDEMAKVLLDHIEVLTETANQFSDFAKLYSEEPVEIKLDTLLQEEVAMYDSRPGVTFEYLGLPDTMIHGPRPQLVRVFVNLLNNAVQALEGRDDAKVMVSLRNGTDPKFYEIVFEDNGPGVDDANIDRLFTPKFTTKSSGSGLGLSICRSILERCGATISYSRSFRLGGACFTILYPKD